MYKDTTKYQDIETPKCLSKLHLPVVICIDTSGSMNEILAGTKLTKSKIMENLLNQIANMDDIPLYEKEAIDLCILAFDDEVRTISDWRPLLTFHGNIDLDIAGRTALGSAVIASIDKLRECRKLYQEVGIESDKGLIFLFTDGSSTESMSEAYQKAEWIKS